ncbi:rCG50788, partial [Rattus norvegicus]
MVNNITSLKRAKGLVMLPVSSHRLLESPFNPPGT